MALVRSPAQLSAAVAPGSVNAPRPLHDALPLSTSVSTGAVVSSTLTVRVTSRAALLDGSLTLYSTEELTTELPSPHPVTGRALVGKTTQLSAPVAPGSVNVPWPATVSGLLPTSV